MFGWCFGFYIPAGICKIKVTAFGCFYPKLRFWSGTAFFLLSENCGMWSNIYSSMSAVKEKRISLILLDNFKIYWIYISIGSLSTGAGLVDNVDQRMGTITLENLSTFWCPYHIPFNYYGHHQRNVLFKAVFNLTNLLKWQAQLPLNLKSWQV